MATKLDEGDDIALQRAWLLVLCRWRNPLEPCQGSKGTQEPLLVQVPQPVLHHGPRAPLVGGDKSHRHLLEHGKVRRGPNDLSL